MICLCAAWIFARNTGRDLIVDWRNSIYSTDDRNLFDICFEQGERLGGVSLLPAGTPLPQPRYPQLWSIESLASAPWKLSPDAAPEYRDAMVELIRSGDDHPAATVLFNACVNDGVVTFADAHACLSDLRFASRIVSAANAFQAEKLGHSAWIGLHMRHGNGGDIMGHTPSWVSPSGAIKRCLAAVDHARTLMGSNAIVFLCTDSAEVEAAVTDATSGIVTLRKHFAPAGIGELHLGGRGAAGLDAALTEMLLLSRAPVLIRYPAASFFSFYPAIMKPSNAGPVETITELQQAYRPDDPLAPSVLI